MKKILFLSFIIICLSLPLMAQKEENEDKEKIPFRENLFTGGSISLAFYNNTFLVGGSPVLGYSATNWMDLGIVVNYNYTAYRDYNNILFDKLRQSVYGGGGFIKLYPLRFLFAQVQVEYNTIRQKYIPASGNRETYKADAGSYLIGGGYTSGREGRGGRPFFYLAVLFDISDNVNSPYTDAYGRTIPIVRGGIQIPLFQGSRRK